jgi:2-polyprenyl-3-methyl-5-hydroxy-6-metoxy-1,4-benzoquinol methylase
MREVRSCQREIAAIAENPFYAKNYRGEETWYWLRIPGWMSELAASGFRVRRALDIGCAYGTLALFCRRTFDCEIYCTDFNDVCLSPALRNEYAFHFAINNIERDDFPWELRFEAVIFTEVLEHLNFHPLSTLRKIRDLLTPDGKLFLTTPDAEEWGRATRYYSRLDEIPELKPDSPTVDDHVWQYTKDELFGVLEESGLKIDRFSYSPGTPNRHFNLQASVK